MLHKKHFNMIFVSENNKKKIHLDLLCQFVKPTSCITFDILCKAHR